MLVTSSNSYHFFQYSILFSKLQILTQTIKFISNNNYYRLNVHNMTFKILI